MENCPNDSHLQSLSTPSLPPFLPTLADGHQELASKTFSTADSKIILPPIAVAYLNLIFRGRDVPKASQVTAVLRMIKMQRMLNTHGQAMSH